MARVRPGRLATAALAVLLVTGCAQNAPGVAAQVGDDRITDEQVDELAESLCLLSTESPDGPVPSQQLRLQALQILLDSELANDIIDPDSVDEEQLAATLQEAEVSRDALPERLRASFADTVERFATGQLGLLELGRESLVEKGTEEPDEQAALAEGARLRTRHARQLGVEVDPRFGSYERGQLQPSDGSLSVPVSEEAEASATAAGAGSDLPANLSCDAG